MLLRKRQCWIQRWTRQPNKQVRFAFHPMHALEKHRMLNMKRLKTRPRDENTGCFRLSRAGCASGVLWSGNRYFHCKFWYISSDQYAKTFLTQKVLYILDRGIRRLAYGTIGQIQRFRIHSTYQTKSSAWILTRTTLPLLWPTDTFIFTISET